MSKTNAIDKKSKEYAMDVVCDALEHMDAVEASSEDFAEGACWMLERMCEFLKKDLMYVKVFSDKTAEPGMDKSEIVYIKDNTPAEFIERFRKSMIEGEYDK